MKIVGQMALYRSLVAEQMLDNLSAFCDSLYLRFDAAGRKDLLEYAVWHPKTNRVLVSKAEWGRQGPVTPWREEMIRMLDDVEPDIVLSLDEDECFSEGILEDIKAFAESKYQQALFTYEMVTNDGVDVRTYPERPHGKMFKWRHGLTFKPGTGCCIPDQYPHRDKAEGFFAQSKILHWCWRDYPRRVNSNNCNRRPNSNKEVKE